MTTVTWRRFARVNIPSYPEFAELWRRGLYSDRGKHGLKFEILWKELKKLLVSAPKDARIFSVTAMWSNEAMSKNLPKDSKDVWVLK